MYGRLRLCVQLLAYRLHVNGTRSLEISCDVQCVRGSFSARVPRSSFARVRRVLVSHMEEEGEEQENEKEDEREDGMQRVEEW